MKQLHRIAPLRPRITHPASGIGVQKLIHKFVLLAITFAMFAISAVCRAQGQEPNGDLNQNPNLDSAIEVARADMRAQKATIISEGMNFNAKDGAAFWPIYRQYENQRASLDDSRVAVIKQYAQKYPNLTDAEAKAMAERMFEYDSRLAELKKKYFKKFNKVLPALTVTTFFQLDRRIDLLADMNVESSLPPLTQAQYVEKRK
jgi:hypothetical protein